MSSLSDLARYFAARREALRSPPSPPPLRVALCANADCEDKPGLLACTKCKLVKYCCKSCQVAHWPKHKQDCNHEYNKPYWQPAWVRERRDPAYVLASAPAVTYGSARQSRYLWGNVPAIDCLCLSPQESASSSGLDLNICFAAAGDIRNLVSTINGLPNDYSGHCRILLNDLDPCVITRNLLILHALLRPGPSIEMAAETALHLWYSAILRSSDAAELYFSAEAVYKSVDLQAAADASFVNILELRGKSLLSASLSMNNLASLGVLMSKYNVSAALNSMREIMTAPSRVDYRDRHLASLKPAHRVAWARNRRIGALLPFSADASAFTEPNRSMFTPTGEWMTMDNANQLYGWPTSAVLQSGQRNGLDGADIWGCLFVHVREQLAEMARRVERFHIDIYITQMDAKELAASIKCGAYPGFSSDCFDRIETSNVVDCIGLDRVLDDWGPLLRRDKRASLLAYTMNWHVNRPGPSDHRVHGRLVEKAARALNVDLSKLMQARFMNPMDMSLRAQLLTLDFYKDAFDDNAQSFNEWLNEQKSTPTARKHGLRMRAKNRIHPKRFGVPLGAGPRDVPDMTPEDFYNTYVVGGADAPVRFMEFEVI